MKTLGCLFILLVAAPLAAYVNALVLLQVYNWFLATIPGAPALRVTHFVGLSLIAGGLLAWLHKSDDDKNTTLEERMLGVIAKAFALPLVNLFFAWFYKTIFGL